MGMSKLATPLEVVQAQYAASAAGDLQALRATLADDKERYQACPAFSK